MNKQIFAFALILVASQAMASEKWKGTGGVFSPDGQKVETYEVTAENKSLGGGAIQSDVTFVFSSGTTKTTTQKITFFGNKWSVDSSLGKGGGACYGSDICENRIADDAGMAYATTIINDGKYARRNVTFELKDGKPIRVLRDQLVRMQ